jgi:hypothetical protein
MKPLMPVCAFVLALIASAPISAKPDAGWKGPGWYQVILGEGAFLWAGPFDDYRTCNATLPADEEDGTTYRCKNFKTQPDDSKDADYE